MREESSIVERLDSSMTLRMMWYDMLINVIGPLKSSVAAASASDVESSVGKKIFEKLEQVNCDYGMKYAEIKSEELAMMYSLKNKYTSKDGTIELPMYLISKPADNYSLQLNLLEIYALFMIMIKKTFNFTKSKTYCIELDVNGCAAEGGSMQTVLYNVLREVLGKPDNGAPFCFSSIEGVEKIIPECLSKVFDSYNTFVDQQLSRTRESKSCETSDAGILGDGKKISITNGDGSPICKEAESSQEGIDANSSASSSSSSSSSSNQSGRSFLGRPGPVTVPVSGGVDSLLDDRPAKRQKK